MEVAHLNEECEAENGAQNLGQCPPVLGWCHGYEIKFTDSCNWIKASRVDAELPLACCICL